MKTLIALIAIVCLTAIAQVTVLETETVEITTKLIRVATTFRNDTLTGELAGADVEFVRVKLAGTNVLSITPGQSLHLTASQITNVLTTFASSQTALDAALASMITNAP